jgi:uncharacterized protein (TIGR02646 family)
MAGDAAWKGREDMIHVQHPAPVPPLLDAEYRANPAPADTDAAWGAFQGKGEVRQALEPVQHGICAYCEESLATWGCHIDHVVPKSRDAAGTFLFSNLVLSCIESGDLANISGSSCGHFRGSEYDPILFIKPTEADCSGYLSCQLPNGNLRAAPGVDAQKRERADYMIQKLHLNCLRLNRRRRDWLAAITRDLARMTHDREATRQYLQYCLARGQPFLTVVQEYFGWI